VEGKFVFELKMWVLLSHENAQESQNHGFFHHRGHEGFFRHGFTLINTAQLFNFSNISRSEGREKTKPFWQRLFAVRKLVWCPRISQFNFFNHRQNFEIQGF
jgi:hypothetical protein